MSDAQMTSVLRAVTSLEGEDAAKSGELICDLMLITPEIQTRWSDFLASIRPADELNGIGERVLEYIRDQP